MQQQQATQVAAALLRDSSHVTKQPETTYLHLRPGRSRKVRERPYPRCGGGFCCSSVLATGMMTGNRSLCTTPHALTQESSRGKMALREAQAIGEDAFFPLPPRPAL